MKKGFYKGISNGIPERTDALSRGTPRLIFWKHLVEVRAKEQNSEETPEGSPIKCQKDSLRKIWINP